MNSNLIILWGFLTALCLTLGIVEFAVSVYLNRQNPRNNFRLFVGNL